MIGFPPTTAAARARLAAIDPHEYARSRNALDGAVTRLSPYLSHGLLNLPEVMAALAERHGPLHPQHKLVYEFGWREYFHHVWQRRGDAIFRSLHAGPLPDRSYASELPADIREAHTGVPVIDKAVRLLYAEGYLHNHLRLWLASYIVHLRKVHWRSGADWMYGHLLDGDLASNHLSWQWVAGTGSHKPYLFNAGNVARHAPPDWHSPGTVIDTSYEALDAIARSAEPVGAEALQAPGIAAPALHERPPAAWSAPDAQAVAGRDVWLVHAWALADPPPDLPDGTVSVAVFEADHLHARWPWNAARWTFVGQRMSELAALRWWGDASALGAALSGARSVQMVADPHLSPALHGLARCRPRPLLFTPVARHCDSFSQWWKRASAVLTLSARS